MVRPDTIRSPLKSQNVAEDGMITWTVDPDGTGTTPDLQTDDVNGGMPIVQFQPGAILTVTEVSDGGREWRHKDLNPSNRRHLAVVQVIEQDLPGDGY